LLETAAVADPPLLLLLQKPPCLADMQHPLETVLLLRNHMQQLLQMMLLQLCLTLLLLHLHLILLLLQQHLHPLLLLPLLQLLLLRLTEVLSLQAQLYRHLHGFLMPCFGSQQHCAVLCLVAASDTCCLAGCGLCSGELLMIAQ
jgi:hypothetical protein